MEQTIWIVEDDLEIAKYITHLLRENSYCVAHFPNGIEALNRIEETPPDLVLLDLTLPGISGEGVCLEIRKKYPFLPIIILTAKDAVADKVKGFRMGADDYINKPFAPEELIARIQARLRPKNTQDNTILRVADVELNPQTIEVKRASQPITLTPQEFKLLHYLMTNVGIVLTREMILSRIWMSSEEVETRVVDVYIGYLRKKIDANHKHKLIHSVRGFGYILRP